MTPQQRSQSPGAARKALTGLTLVQVIGVMTSMVTSPLLARALGPHGRGVLSAVMVPVGLVPYVGQLGLGAFAVNGAARGIQPRVLVGSLGVPLLAVGALLALTSSSIAHALARHQPAAVPYLTVGLALAPLALLTTLLLDILWGLERWRALLTARFLTPVVLLISVVVLTVLHSLTTASASVLFLASGLVATTTVIPALSRFGSPRVDRAVLSSALRFGLRAWPGTLANLGNQRLDQLLMIPLVPARQLGLYAVAVSVSGLSSVFTSQVVTVLVPRFAEGELRLLAPAVRMTILIAWAAGLVLAAGTVVFLPTIFGTPFADARGPVLVLLVAALATAASGTLSQVFAAVGRPGVATMSEFAAILITVPGLILLLPTLGAMGAALVSLLAYLASFVLLVLAATKRFNLRLRDLLLPRASDLQWIFAVIRRPSRGSRRRPSHGSTDRNPAD